MARPAPAAATHASPAMAGMISHSGRHRPYLLMPPNRAARARVSGATASWITTTAAMAPAAKFRRGFPVPVLRRFARDESSSALPVGYSGTMAQDSTSVRGMPPARQQQAWPYSKRGCRGGRPAGVLANRGLVVGRPALLVAGRHGCEIIGQRLRRRDVPDRGACGRRVDPGPEPAR